MSSSANPQLVFDPASLPLAHLESLRFKANAMVESIQLLQRTLDLGGYMPPWPEILSKYTILLSQSHNLSNSLLGPLHSSTSAGPSASGNIYERLALHPKAAMTDSQLDNELIPLLRNQQTTDVLKLETDTVRHLAEHMETKGSLGAMAQAGPLQGRRTEYEDVMRECEQIRVEHDERVDRAVRAVAMLREKYDWRARVEVDQEEPEEIEWATHGAGSGQAHERMSEDGDDPETPSGDQSNDSDEEEELEEVLGDGGDHTPDGTPTAQG
ncbi:uncharacterized protein B0H18DRAFT_1032403 [Fomitopsis serialis]|uniref:uncharacterized protein n=1 Tax=Fomitopsis serialis TaxID=139415 RepID=UPI0020084817|nr:uncharacterized protein B0H18DRAFT_1032403 [Neoantrodia serialis]KAH9918058.1 hypothetical protein B0H18DRAFT_1032403 [Neoantrodia serialis]